MKCHTVTEKGARPEIYWQPVESELKAKTFTSFNHSAHFSLVGDAGCQMCHRINSEAEYAKYFSGRRERKRTVIRPVSRATFPRLTKHSAFVVINQKLAGDGCLLCHRYHVGRPLGGLVSAEQLLKFSAPPSGGK